MSSKRIKKNPNVIIEKYQSVDAFKNYFEKEEERLKQQNSFLGETGLRRIANMEWSNLSLEKKCFYVDKNKSTKSQYFS